MGFRIRDVDLLYTQQGTIHAEFTHNFWVSALWNQIMGDQTLADVVAGIFTGVTSAVQTVKKGLSKAWDGIKSSGSFIVNEVFSSITQGLNFVILNSLAGLLIIVAELIRGKSYKNLNTIILESDSASNTLRTFTTSTEIIIQSEKDELISIDVMKLILDLLLPIQIETLGLYFEEEIPDLNAVFFNFMIAIIMGELGVLGLVTAIEGMGINKIESAILAITSTLFIIGGVLINIPLFPTVNRILDNAQTQSLFDNMDQQTLYTEHFRRFLISWISILIASLAILYTLTQSRDGITVKFIDKFTGDMASTLLTTGSEGVLTLVTTILLLLGFMTLFREDIIPTFVTFWPMLLVILLVLLSIRFEVLIIPTMIVILTMLALVLLIEVSV